MKLIDVIRKVIIEETRDEESSEFDFASDREREQEDRRQERERERQDRELEREREREREIELEDDEGCEEYVTISDYPEDMIPARCREFVINHREREGRDRPQNRPRVGNWVCMDPVNYPGCQEVRSDSDARRISMYRFPFYRSQDECIAASPCRGSREARPRTRPTTTVQPIRTQPTQSRPTQVQTTTEPTQGTTDAKETPKTDVPNINMNTKYESDDKIKDIKKTQSNKFIKIVQEKLVKQLELQPPQIKRKLKQFNVQPKNMSYLVPLSNTTGTLMLKMELDGLNLPLMMVLYKNTDRLYKSMTDNKQFTPNQARPISGAIDYKNFWKWNNQIYDSWGSWLRVNVAKNFPEISKNTFPSLSF